MIYKVTDDLLKELGNLKGKTISRSKLLQIVKKYEFEKVSSSIQKAGNGDVLIKYANYNKSKKTTSEEALEKMLKKMKIKYKYQFPVWAKDESGTYGYIIDFVIESSVLGKKIAIEIDGGYHEHLPQQIKDAKRDKIFRDSGWIVVRLKNEEVGYDAFFHKMMIANINDINLNKQRFLKLKYFATTDISGKEDLLNQLVYELYGLTEEEIAIVEGR